MRHGSSWEFCLRSGVRSRKRFRDYFIEIGEMLSAPNPHPK